jgi:hypothetical protein
VQPAARPGQRHDLRRGLRRVTAMYPELWLRREGFQLEWFIWTRARFEELV